MALDQGYLGADKRESTLLVLFIPSHDREENRIGQEQWVASALEFLGRAFGGATAFPQGRGVWRDDAMHGRLVFDEPVIVNCYTSEQAIEAHAVALRDFLTAMGNDTNQGAVGFVVDRDYFEMRF